MDEHKLQNEIKRLEEYFLDDSANKENLLDKFFDFLVESEAQALALIKHIKHPNEKPTIPEGGEIEIGFFLYWIHHPPIKLKDWFKKHLILNWIFKILQKDAPPTKITVPEYNLLMAKIETVGVTWVDGTIFGTSKFEQLDHNWILTGLNYAINLIHKKSIAPFPNKAPLNGTLLSRKPIKHTKPEKPRDPVIGIIGDWGTGDFVDSNNGTCPAMRVLKDIKSQELDYLLHLGDVYYSGTDGRPWPGEEEKHLMNLWPDMGEKKDRSFTLNSNHEMSGDAHGYFDIALRSNGPFASQNGMSYFSLKYDPWLVLGLDSSYYSDAKNGDKFYMYGAIGTDKFQQQIKWLEGFRNHKGPIMICSHHNPCSLPGDTVNVLFDQVSDALGRMPNLWYWGHVHNGIVYKQLHIGNAISTIPTKGRCCGHASIPFGIAWQIENNDNIVYLAKTHDPNFPANNPRVKNGYATVTLHGDGGFTESFYEVGSLKAVYTKKWKSEEVMEKK